MTTAPAPPTIRRLDRPEAALRLHELGAVLADAVAQGASVNFLAGFTAAEAEDFWRAQLPALAEGAKRLLVAERDGRIVGTVILALAPQPNGPHRAEVGKMLVHSAHRRQGLGRRLLEAAEAEARAAGRSLLLLDTESGSAGDHLYRRCGWTAYGSVPGFALDTAGRPAAATMFFKVLPG